MATNTTSRRFKDLPENTIFEFEGQYWQKREVRDMSGFCFNATRYSTAGLQVVHTFKHGDIVNVETNVGS